MRKERIWKKTLTICLAAMLLIVLTACNVDVNVDGENVNVKLNDGDIDVNVDGENVDVKLGDGSIDVNVNAENVDAENDDNSEEIKDEESTVTVKVGGLKGPTSIGLMKLKDETGKSEGTAGYDFTMATAADEITTALVKGDLDIALIPANVASVLYNKTKGGISVIDINTLGVLYMVTGDKDIKEVGDLEGKTIYLTGKGTTPDYVLQYLLTENGIIDNVKLEYKSEATEVAAVLAEDEMAIGLLPQPFVTVACAQNEKLAVVMDMNKLWEEADQDSGSRLVTGVTVVRNDFLNSHKEEVDKFLEDHKASVSAVDDEVELIAKLTVQEGIIPKEPIAMKAIPNCNIVCITDEEMKEALEGYLEVLFEFNPESVGNSLPGEDFYYKK